MKKRMRKLLMVLALICVGMVVKGNDTVAKGADGVLRYQKESSRMCAVQVNSKIYYTTYRAGYIYCYNIKNKTNKKLAEVPKEKRDKNTSYFYPADSTVTSMFYYKGYLYCEVRSYDALMSYGIIRVNVKNGNVKKLYYTRTSCSSAPDCSFQFSIYNDKIYYSYSTGSIVGGVNKIKVYFAVMNLDGSHKKIIETKGLTKDFRKYDGICTRVYEDCLYEICNNRYYKMNKKGKKTRIKSMPVIEDGMKYTTSKLKYEQKTDSWIFECGDVTYNGYEYTADDCGLQRKNLKTGATKVIDGKDSYKVDSTKNHTYRSYIVLGDYILVCARTYDGTSDKDSYMYYFIDNTGKKKINLYSKVIIRELY